MSEPLGGRTALGRIGLDCCATRRHATMPRYLIERHFPDGLALPADERGDRMAATVISNNAQDGVT